MPYALYAVNPATSWGDYTAAAIREKVEAASVLVLGHREVRMSDSTLFERSERANPVDDSKRCYGLTNMIKRPRMASGPSAALKVTHGTLDDMQRGARDLVTVSSHISASVLVS